MSIHLTTPLQVAGEPEIPPIYSLHFKALDPNPAEGPEAGKYVRISLIGRGGAPLHFVDIPKVDLLTSLGML